MRDLFKMYACGRIGVGRSLHSRLHTGVSVLAVTLVLAAVETAAAKGTIITFDVPSALGTFATGIGNDGSVTGWYVGSGPQQGFVRAPDGTFTTFNPKGSHSTNPTGINGMGVIAGWYYNSH